MTQPTRQLTKQVTYIPNNGNLPIPSREEFHRYTSNYLTEHDFCTNHPSRDGGMQVSKVASAIRWTQRNANNKNSFKFR